MEKAKAREGGKGSGFATLSSGSFWRIFYGEIDIWKCRKRVFEGDGDGTPDDAR